jgi:hypothetical protein
VTAVSPNRPVVRRATPSSPKTSRRMTGKPQASSARAWPRADVVQLRCDSRAADPVVQSPRLPPRRHRRALPERRAALGPRARTVAPPAPYS